jgi:glycosyltransferase involved in cell wall biosynthesis
LIELYRDKKRKLGFTRNISIENARGEYVIMHLDCDDIFGPYIMDFIKIFHKLEVCYGRDILVSGEHINMGRREFLLSNGPYINIYRGEDRNLWIRMAAIGAWVRLMHRDFIIRLPKTRKKRIIKSMVDTFDHMKNDFRSGVSLSQYVRYEIIKRKRYTLKLFIFRMAMLVPSWFAALFEKPILQGNTFVTPEAFALYRENIQGAYPEIMRRYGVDPSLSFLRSKDAEYIFGNRGEIK